MSKHCEVFLWRGLAGGRKSPLTASLTLAVKSVSMLLTITGQIQIQPAYVRSLTVRLLFEKVNFNGRNQIVRPAHTFTQRIDDLMGLTLTLSRYLRSSDSHLTGLVKSNTPCLSSHEDVYIFQFQQATIFTATLLFQPQLITTMYIQLQMISIYIVSLLFYTRVHTHYFIHSVKCKKFSDALIKTKDNILLNLF